MQANSTTMASAPSSANAKIRWWYGLLVVLVIAAGWYYPYLGLMAPLVMGAGMVGGLFRGRYVCGNFCPRGSFLDTWMSAVAGRRSLPSWVRRPWFRGLVMTGLMGFLGWRLAQNPGSLEHWGFVFWQMCFLTTLAALALGLAFSARAWCMVCPMGSMQAFEGQGRYPLQVAADCRACQRCEQNCPMGIPVTAYRGTGQVTHPDCIKCSRCLASCPTSSLSWPG